jgi:hypothetical protein
MPVMLEHWNDDNMDALKTEIDGLGCRVGELDRRMELGFEQVGKRLEEVNAELREQRRDIKSGFERVDDRFERMQRMMSDR